MLKPLLVAFAFSFAAPVAAQAVESTPAVANADVVKAGRTLRDSANARLGKIDQVNADGSVRIIFDTRFVTIPADTISVAGNEPVTSLSKREVSKLR